MKTFGYICGMVCFALAGYVFALTIDGKINIYLGYTCCFTNVGVAIWSMLCGSNN